MVEAGMAGSNQRRFMISCLDMGSSGDGGQSGVATANCVAVHRNIERHDEGLEYGFVNVFWDWD